MHITITIKTDNEAFADNPWGEVGRILQQLARNGYNGTIEHGQQLYDVNGNTVGRVEFTGAFGDPALNLADRDGEALLTRQFEEDGYRDASLSALSRNHPSDSAWVTEAYDRGWDRRIAELKAVEAAFEAHRAADPHCTCNDCLDYFAQSQEGR